ncbi:MAG: hypothetical protein WC455_11225 [Dehalococcoidia bacterium]
MTTLRRQWVINKMVPCNCGCHGQDPWHKSNYRRLVNQTSDTEGWVKMPYSTKPVRVTRRAYDATHFGPWIVDRDSITWDKG